MNDRVQDTMADDDATGAGATGSRWGRTWLAMAIVATVLLLVLTAWRQGWFTPTSHVFLELPGASGVQTGTPVRLKGFKIGEVDRMTLERSLTVRIRLRLDRDKMDLLGSDTRARFGRDSLLAGKFIELAPGQREGPRLAAGKVLPVDEGSEIEDMMSALKQTAEQVTLTLKKVDPILDNTRKLSRDAAALLADARAPMQASLANAQALTRQLQQLSQSAQALMARVDQDRGRLVGDVQVVLKQAQAAASSAEQALAGLDVALPGALGKLDTVLDNARTVSTDLKQVLAESRGDIPPLVQSGRSAARDAAELTGKLKNTWPLSAGNKPPQLGPLPLDSFEGAPR